MNNEKSRVLCLFTSSYPYGSKVETFIDSEIEYMESSFKHIYIFPASNESGIIRRKFSEKFEIITFSDNWSDQRNKLFLKNFILILNVYLQEFLFNSNKNYSFKELLKNRNILIHRLYKAQQIDDFLKKHDVSDAVCYSYWLNEWAIVLGILKVKKKIKSFFCRAHGFDIYEERWSKKYIPFRYFQLKHANAIYSVSKKGEEYLLGKYPSLKSIYTSYLGVRDNGLNNISDPNIFVLVSCSNPIPLKRVHLIVEILKNINWPLKWIHFGDGDSLEDLKRLAAGLKSNISVEFKGHVPNEKIIEYYRFNQVNLQILVSEIEGLPMSLIEASSFGIPLMATDVGGVSEIVNEKTGELISKDFDAVQVADLLTKFSKGYKNTMEFRKSVKGYWTQKFDADMNYKSFYTRICN